MEWNGNSWCRITPCRHVLRASEPTCLVCGVTRSCFPFAPRARMMLPTIAFHRWSDGSLLNFISWAPGKPRPISKDKKCVYMTASRGERFAYGCMGVSSLSGNCLFDSQMGNHTCACFDMALPQQGRQPHGLHCGLATPVHPQGFQQPCIAEVKAGSGVPASDAIPLATVQIQDKETALLTICNHIQQHFLSYPQPPTSWLSTITSTYWQED